MIIVLTREKVLVELSRHQHSGVSDDEIHHTLHRILYSHALGRGDHKFLAEKSRAPRLQILRYRSIYLHCCVLSFIVFGRR